MKHFSSPLPRRFYEHETTPVALDLLGKVLVHTTPEGATAGKIVETEAYPEGDPSSHSTSRRNEHTEVIWGEPGFSYVYLIYGMYACLNVVVEPPGKPGCVLIRALEPLAGIPLMEARRRTTKLMNLASGPGKLTQALGITVAHTGVDMTQGNLVILDNTEDLQVVVTTRIGITKAAHRPLRFFVKDSPFVSYPNKGQRFFEGTVEEAKEVLINI